MVRMLTISCLIAALFLTVTCVWADAAEEKELLIKAEEAKAVPDYKPIGPIGQIDQDFEEIPYAWIEINPAHPGALPGTNSGIINDDHNVGPFDIGFDFPWYDGATHNTIRLCSNGFASFTSTSSTWTNQVIPYSSEPNNTGYGSVWYYYDAANNRFIAEWDSCAHYNYPNHDGVFTFELILYPDGTIDYMYKMLDPGTVTPFPSATVGVENSTGTVGIQVTYNGSGPLEPENEMGIRVYPLGGPPEISVSLIPFTDPVQIPASGGSFEFYAFVTNSATTAQEAGLWIYMIDPSGVATDPVLGPGTANLQPGTTGWYRIQNIAGTAAPGVWTYVGNAGVYPDTVWGSDSFEFEKLATGDGPWVGNWNNWGDPMFGEEMEAQDALPTDFVMHPAHPNPFNPTTTIGFALPEAARVSLNVYDVSGRLVAKLIDGWRDAGLQEITFDASNLATGVYIYHLTAGKHNAAGKMVLMK